MATDEDLLENLETKLSIFRAYVHACRFSLAVAAVFSITMIATALTGYLQIDYPQPQFLLINGVAIAMICGHFFNAMNIPDEAGEVNSNGYYPNLHTLLKACVGIMVIAFFTAIENWLKDMNRFCSILLCLGSFLHIIISMIAFKIGEDFDLAGNFLTATVSLFYERTQGLDILVLFLTCVFLAFLKGYLLGGQSLLLNNSLPPVMIPAGFLGKNERRLAKFRAVVHNSSFTLACASSIALVIVGLSILYLAYVNRFPIKSMFTLCFLICICILFHFIYARNRTVGALDIKGTYVYPNLYCIAKSIGGTMVIFVFTAIESTLKDLDRFSAITLCGSVYVYLVVGMVFFRMGEDFDLAGAFLGAAYVLFYENSKGLEILALMFTCIVLASLKTYLVGGQNLVEPRRTVRRLQRSPRSRAMKR